MTTNVGYVCGYLCLLLMVMTNAGKELKCFKFCHPILHLLMTNMIFHLNLYTYTLKSMGYLFSSDVDFSCWADLTQIGLIMCNPKYWNWDVDLNGNRDDASRFIFWEKAGSMDPWSQQSMGAKLAVFSKWEARPTLSLVNQ